MLVTLVVHSSKAQNSSWLTAEPPMRLLASPTASSIANNSSETVDMYTGKVNITLPLHTLKGRDIEVPISLHYSSGGVRVNDIAGWVGMHWSLQAGGCVSRVMKNLPDEFLGKVVPLSHYKLHTDPDFTGIDGFGFIHLKSVGINLNDFSTLPLDEKRKIVRNGDWMSIDGHQSGLEAYDTEPDEFYFNFGKYSGYMVFDRDGKLKSIPHQNLKVTHTIKQVTVNDIQYLMISSFTFITDDGYKYTFGDYELESVERTRSISYRASFGIRFDQACENNLIDLDDYTTDWVWDPVLDDPEVHLWKTMPMAVDVEVDVNGNARPKPSQSETNMFFSSSWYLKTIESPSGDIMNFNYTAPLGEEGLTYTQSQGVTKKLNNDMTLQTVTVEDNPRDIPVGTYFSTPPGNLSPFQRPDAITLFKNKISLDQKVLTSIVSSTGESVAFVRQAEERKDLPNDHALELIRIYDYTNTNIKTFRLQYIYMEPTGAAPRWNAFVGKAIVNGIEQNLVASENISDAEFEGERRRLLLQKVFEFKDDATIVPTKRPFEFNYNPTVLPRRGFNKKDLWGFYSEANGAVDLANAAAGVLTKIYYPTGGAKEFIYESNQAIEMNSGNAQVVGGLRVKQVRLYPQPGVDPILTDYTYTGNTIKGEHWPTRGYEIFITPDIEDDPRSDSYVADDAYNPWGVTGYDAVRVSTPGNGKTIYVFTTSSMTGYGAETLSTEDEINFSGIHGTDNDYPFVPRRRNDWMAGWLKGQSFTLDDETKILQKKQTTYDVNAPFDVIFGLVPATYTFANETLYRYGKYEHVSSWADITAEVTTVYDSQTPGNESTAVATTTTSEYTQVEREGRKYHFLKSSTIDSPETGSIKTEYRYPFDITSATMATDPSDPVSHALLQMAKTDGKHMLSYPIETIRYRNGKITESLIRSFKGFPDKSSTILPYQNFLLETNTPLVTGNYTVYQLAPTVTGNIMIDAKCKVQSTINRYDAAGNVQEYTTIDGITVTVLYGYNKMYPVAEIKNATFQDVLAVLPQGVLDQLNNAPGSDDLMRSKLQPLRTATSLEKAVITTYTYTPGIGMSSMTDPMQLTTYYEYDALNRLKIIRVKTKDETNKSIVKTYDYNFQFK
jgi:hypothetical protein